MKVKDLMDALSKCNPDGEIEIYAYPQYNARSTFLINNIEEKEVVYTERLATPVIVTINLMTRPI
jgi:hypothetical protein